MLTLTNTKNIKNNFVITKKFRLKNITKNQVIELKRNLEKFGVVVFENQKLNYKDLLKISNFLGKAISHNYLDKISKYPQISKIIKKKNDKKMFGGEWHTDSSYLKKPPKFTILYSIKVPGDNLGGTHFASLYNPYSLLSLKIKKKLGKLYVCHSSDTQLSKFRKKKQKNKIKKEFTSLQKLIKNNKSNNKSIYFSPGHFKNFYDEKKRKINSKKEIYFIKILKNKILAKKNIFTYNWKKNSLVIWNNTKVLHKPQNNFKNKERVMLRLNII